MIKLDHVSHQFGDLPVVDDVSIDLDDGEFVAIIGPSGCGKSTLLRLLTGLLSPSSGQVLAGDRVFTGTTGEVGYLPQGDSLLPWLRAVDNACLGLEASGMSRNEARNKALELFKTFGLDGFDQAWPHELSGGMRQRVAVLRTFLLPHKALALDEPFGALDAITRRQIQTWMRGVWLQDRRTTMLITHDIEEALLLADRVLVMSSRPGRIETSISVDLDEARPVGVETSQEFVAIKRLLLDVLTAA